MSSGAGMTFEVQVAGATVAEFATVEDAEACRRSLAACWKWLSVNGPATSGQIGRAGYSTAHLRTLNQVGAVFFEGGRWDASEWVQPTLGGTA